MMEGTVANKKRKTNPLPVLWEIVRVLSEDAPIVNHSKGVIKLTDEMLHTAWDKDTAEMYVSVKELTFDVPDAIRETPSVISMGGELWDVCNVSDEQQLGNQDYGYYQLGVIVSRREEQFNIGSGDTPHFLGTFNIGSGDDLHFLGTDVSNSPDSSGALTLDGLATLLDVDGGASKRKLARDGIMADGVDHYMAALGNASRQAAEAMRQFAQDIIGPSQMFAAAGQSVADGFANAIKEEAEKGRIEGLAFAAKIQARQQAAAEINDKIVERVFEFENEIYFVLTNKYEVIGFESKQDLDSFLVSRLDTEDYGILMVREYAQWMKGEYIDQVGRLFGIIVQNEGGAQ